MLKSVCCAALVLSASFFTSARAQQAQVLNLNNAVKMGLDYSRQLKASKARSDAAEAHHGVLKDQLIPTVKLSASYTRLSDIDEPKITLPGFAPISLFPVYVDNWYSQASVREVLFAGLRGEYALQSSSYLERAGKLDYEKDRQEVIFNIANAYYNIYKIKAAKKLLEENISQEKERITEVTSYEKNGLATHNDVLKVQLQQSNLQLSLIETSNTLKTVLYNFGLMVGIDPKNTVDVDTMLAPGTYGLAGIDELQQKSTGRADLKAAEMRNQAQELTLKGAKGNYFPVLSAGANYYYANPNSRIVPPENKFFGTWDVGVTLSYDLSAIYTNRHTVSEAAANYAQSKANYDQMTDAAKMEVNQTYYDYLKTQEKIAVAQQSVAQAEENLKIVNSRYSNQVALLTDLLDAELMLLQSRINLSNAQADVQLAYYKVQKATGELKF